MTALSAAGWVWDHAWSSPRAPAVDGPGVRLSYGALARAMASLAGDLSARGFGPGCRLVVALPSGPPAVVSLLAAQMAGGSAVPIDRELQGEALRSVLAQTRARHAVIWAPDAPRWAAIRDLELDGCWVQPDPGTNRNVAMPAPIGSGEERGLSASCNVATGRCVSVGDDGAPFGGPESLRAPFSVTPSDEALVLFTSGSTGEPRGVIQTYGNILANTRSIVAYLGLGPEDRAMAILPLFYCYGLSVLQTHLHAGGSVFLEPRSMYPRVVLDGIAQEGCTGFAGVPLTFELLRRQCDVAASPKPRLRYVTQAGGAMTPDTIRWARRSFHPAPLYVMYGQTEATARLTYLPPEHADTKAGSIGIPIPGVDLRVVGPDGRELPPGEVGELVARGENVTAGYLGAPEETAAAFREDGLHTGDLAYRDRDGFLFIVGRAKEMLKLGGHRVSPVEIERALLDHPAVLDVAVAGAPDALMGETAIGFVVRRAGHAITERELRGFCRQRLPAHSVPSCIRFVTALPRGGSGKLLRPVLARMARATDVTDGRLPSEGDGSAPPPLGLE